MESNVIQKRSELRVMLDVVSALFVRELKTRFGKSKLGYFWVLAQPVALILIISSVFSAAGRTVVIGAEIPLFLLTGILPFIFIRSTSISLANSVKANKALFIYRQVSPIDTIIARWSIETVAYIVSYLSLLVIFLWVGYSVFPERPLEFVFVNLLVILTASGLGLVFCSLSEYVEDLGRILPLVFRPLFFMSGLFFVITSIPNQYWYLFAWNPILHLNELSRTAFFPEYQTPVGSWLYVFLFVLLVNFLGLSLYRINRDRFIAS